MRKSKLIFGLLMLISVNVMAEKKLSIASPDQQIQLHFVNADNGSIQYQVNYKSRSVVAPSSLGFRLSEPVMSLMNFDVLSVDSSVVNNSWEPVWGEQKTIVNHYRELKIALSDRSKDKIRMDLIFRVYNDGVVFRYEFPVQPNLMHFIVADEVSQINMTGDHQAFWIPGDYDTNEYSYYNSALSKIDASGGTFAQEIHAKTFFDSNAVQTPLIMKSKEGIYINIHEAALSNYPAMNLILNKKTFGFQSHLVPDAVGNKAYLQTPAKTPWRTILFSDKASTLLASKTILNCNEPSVIKDPSFIKPQKFVGVWWEMHVGVSSWDYSGGQVGSQQSTRVPHGANTANVKRYIDFAAKYGFNGILVEGWNTGWEDWFGKWKEDVFDFLTPYPDYNIQEINDYAKLKGVRIIMHHETSGSVTNYERYMDKAYELMKKYNMNSVKTGYVGKIIPRGEHHDGQWMVKHYERVARRTGENGIMVDMHEPVRPTGMHRTYPNWLACEAARGNEFNAWSTGNMPEHETILPFTRLMGGPMDYTPGIFKIKMSHYNKDKKEQVHTTLAKQLALYITIYSPLQMAADLPENYEAKPDAFQFIRDVAVDWDDTKILDAEPGDYIYIARKEKGKENWFVGGITDENARAYTIDMSFADKDKKYVATIYKDAPTAHWKDNPEAYTIEKFIVTSKTKMKLDMAPGGGFAISLMPATAEQVKNIKSYRNK
jgi:hypothetical protein